MNKTININLGGYFFHIDETAYQKLRRYLDAISKSLSDDPQGKNEIIADIEARISELLSEKITEARQVVNEQDISNIIKIMGEPEDYEENETGYTDNSSSYQRKKTSNRKLYRDGDDKFLGGVAAGVGHYLGIDAIWLRLLLIALFFSAGFGFLIYIILWVLLPEATTTAEKLEMEGEHVTIDNIEKKIREEFSAIKETLEDGANNVKKKVADGFQKNGKKATSGLQELIGVIGIIFSVLFNMIGKFIGVIIIIFSSIILVLLFLAIFSLGSFELLGYGEDFINLPNFMFDSLIPYWVLAIALFVLIGFPFLILFVLGLRIISSNIKKLGKTVSLSLLGIWIIALLTLLFTGIELGTSSAYNGTKISASELVIKPTDTLHLEMINDDMLFFQETLRRSSKRVFVSDNKLEKIYSTNIKVAVEKSNSETSSIKIRKVSEGRNKTKATENATGIDYKYEEAQNTLQLNGFFLSHLTYRFSDEVVYATIYIPENSTVFLDKTTQSFLYNIASIDSMYDTDMVGHYFKMTDKGLDCTDCIEEPII
ncbi:PspC domain-containing protein [Flavobacteriaceae bacterium]|nr:PspC domain-containing protein [Flavobacteriaceae bacterium]